MDFSHYSVNEIKNYLAKLDEENLQIALNTLVCDKRKSVQALISKHQGLLAKKLAERQRILKLWNVEKELYHNDYKYIAGIDEAGRGPLAGPVVAATVILPPYCIIEGLDDSKKIQEDKRIKLAEQIKKQALAWAIGVVDAPTIDKLNILQATRYAMQLSLNSLSLKPDYILVDGEKNPLIKIAQSGLIKGDAISASIAAASIIAKVHRDYLMKVYDQLFPNYQFAINKGYGTKQHMERLQQFGPSPIHRFSFRPVNIKQSII